MEKLSRKVKSKAKSKTKPQTKSTPKHRIIIGVGQKDIYLPWPKWSRLNNYGGDLSTFINQANRSFHVRDNSMLPNFIAGDEVYGILLKKPWPNHIVWGNAYVIRDNSGQYRVRKLYPVQNKPDVVELRSLNIDAFPNCILKYEWITSIYRLGAFVRRV